MSLTQFQRSSSATLLRRLMPRPLSGHGFQPPDSPIQNQHCLGSIPLEIFLDVAQFLRSGEILNLSLASSQFRTLLLPEMYKTVALESSKACISGLAMLRRHPQLCVFIRTLVVRPNSKTACWPRTDGPINETRVAFSIQELAGNLRHLEEFVWGGEDLPSDYLWLNLRRSCPKLRKISTTTESMDLEPGCELFRFENLTAFSFAVPLQKSPNLTGLPRQLVDMLLHRCPDLEELNLQLGYYSPAIQPELTRLLIGVFPKLRTFHLGLWCAPDAPNTPPPSPSPSPSSRTPSMESFLAAHPALTTLDVVTPGLALLPPTSAAPLVLPALTTFAGSVHALVALAAPQFLHTLDLTGAPVGDSVNVMAVRDALRPLVGLRCLVVRVASPDTLRALLPACGGLTALRVVLLPMVFDKTALVRISTALREFLPHLRALTLYKAHRRTAPSMLTCALRLLADNTALCAIDLAWFASGSGVTVRRQDGKYAVCGSAEGGVCGRDYRYLDVKERGVRAGGGVFARAFRYSLGDAQDLGGNLRRRLVRMRR
ncbi:hypothetical protein C8R46DRAFT_1262862 [Mycena filopes]|nr:hypothetical protein C8R46DRAFT_1262862 [Mycena filopes]